MQGCDWVTGSLWDTEIGKYDDKETCLMNAKLQHPTATAVTYYPDASYSSYYKKCYIQKTGTVVSSTAAGGIVCVLAQKLHINVLYYMQKNTVQYTNRPL